MYPFKKNNSSQFLNNQSDPVTAVQLAETRAQKKVQDAENAFKARLQEVKDAHEHRMRVFRESEASILQKEIDTASEKAKVKGEEMLSAHTKKIKSLEGNFSSQFDELVKKFVSEIVQTYGSR